MTTISISDFGAFFQMCLNLCLYPLNHWGFSAVGDFVELSFLHVWIGLAVFALVIAVLRWMAQDGQLFKIFGMFFGG